MNPIPEPRRILKRTIQCPDCARTWPSRAIARYELHWRITHGVERSPQPEEAQRASRS